MGMFGHRSQVWKLGVGFALTVALVIPSMVRAAPSNSSAALIAPMAGRYQGLVLHGRQLAPLFSQLLSRGALGSQIRPRLQPMARSSDVSPANVGALRVNLTANDIPPGSNIVATAANQVYDAAQLDNQSGANTSQFALYHPPPNTYVASQVQAAFEENWSFSFTTPNIPTPTYFSAYYLATVYPSSAAAMQVGDNVLATLQNTLGQPYDSCSNTGAVLVTGDGSAWSLGSFIRINNPSCYITESVQADTNGGQNEELYLIFKHGNVLVEMDFLPTVADLLNQNLNHSQQQELASGYANIIDGVTQSIESTVNAAVDSGGNAPQPTNTPVMQGPPPQNTAVPAPTSTPVAQPTGTPSTPPQARIDGVVLEIKMGKKFKVTTALKSHVKGYFVAKVEIANGGSQVPAATITYSAAGKVLGTDVMTQLSALKLARMLHLREMQTAGQTLYFADITGFEDKKKQVHAKATMNLTLGSAHDSNTLKFAIKTNCKKVHGKRKCK